jgi:hypothetical protein
MRNRTPLPATSTPGTCGVGKKRNRQDDDSTDEEATRTYKKPRTLASYAGSHAITSTRILNDVFGVHRGRNGGKKDDPEKNHHAEHPEFAHGKYGREHVSWSKDEEKSGAAAKTSLRHLYRQFKGFKKYAVRC